MFSIFLIRGKIETGKNSLLGEGGKGFVKRCLKWINEWTPLLSSCFSLSLSASLFLSLCFVSVFLSAWPRCLLMNSLLVFLSVQESLFWEKTKSKKKAIV